MEPESAQIPVPSGPPAPSLSLHNMELTDDLFMILMQNRNIKVGDIIYYVSSNNGSYSIHKSRIVNRTLEKHEGFRAFFDTYCYHCEDGYKFDSLRLNQPIFNTMTEAMEYVVSQMKADINWAEISLRNAQEHLARLQRSLKVYQKQLSKHD